MRGLRSPLGRAGARSIFTRSRLLAEESKDIAAPSSVSKPWKKKKLAKFGLEDSTAAELQRVSSSRREVDRWIAHPTFYNMLPENIAISAGTDEPERKPRTHPPGKGPVLTWETCVVFPADGTSWHPLNRKVKLTVRVEDLKLRPMQKRRLLDLVESRYKPATDELTITVDKYEQREDNRKEALRLLYVLLEEATNPVAAAIAAEKGSGSTALNATSEDAAGDISA